MGAFVHLGIWAAKDKTVSSGPSNLDIKMQLNARRREERTLNRPAWIIEISASCQSGRGT